MAKGPSMTTELLAHMKNKGQPVAKPNSAHSLEQVFKTVAPKFNEMSCIPAFTMKDKGQLGRLAKAWGSRADTVMDAVCRDWIAFAKGVATELGFKTFPQVPHLPFIVKYEGNAKAFAAVQLTAQTDVGIPASTQTGIPVVEKNQTVTPPKAKKLVILKKGTAQQPQSLVPEEPVKVAVQDEEDKEMSVEELLAFKAKLKS